MTAAPTTNACDHLFIAMIGNVGSGVTTTADQIAAALEGPYGYKVVRIRVSDFIGNSEVAKSYNIDDLTRDEKIDAYQNIGNDMRKRHGHDVLARRCIGEVFKSMSSENRVAYIFDSLKHPAEIETLKKCFDERLITFAVFCPTRVRKARLLDQGISGVSIDKIFDRDEFEVEPNGQKVRDTAYLADFFVRNSDSSRAKLEKTISRYLEILFVTKIHSPTADETGMARAFGAAISSTCLSRQVGAAVYNAEGKLLATGYNDVPKFGGGLYGEDDPSETDSRCFKWKNGQCHNDEQKSSIYEEIVNRLMPPKIAGKQESKIRAYIINEIKSTRVRDLIEFSRSVHAEMDAIVSVARHGTGSIRGGTLFSKTFPCHNCARHIVASGIKRVVFVEPYPKSLALKLHEDSITVKDEESKNRVFFVQYEGVSPKVFSRFFGFEGSRKINGRFAPKDSRHARPPAMPVAPSYVHEAGIYSLEDA